jgi:predicted dehydrogenase
MAQRQRIRYAVVGLGNFAQKAILPAFAKAKNSALVALVSGDRAKREDLAHQYSPEHVLGYEEFDTFLEKRAVDAVYVALPNSMHAEYTERAAAQGVNVLCEKPLALTEEEAERMTRACERRNVRLMVGYRLHFAPGYQSTLEAVHSGELGEPQLFSSHFSMQVEEGNIRTSAELGGGPLYDIGIYCINAARHVFRAEPIEAFAFAGRPPGDVRFVRVEGHLGAVLRFPKDRMAVFSVGFDATHSSRFEILCERGRATLEPAYSYDADFKQTLGTDEDSRRRTFRKRDQVAAQVVHFSRCILEAREPEPGAGEGIADLRVIDALSRSMREGRPVELGNDAAPESAPLPSAEMVADAGLAAAR